MTTEDALRIAGDGLSIAALSILWSATMGAWRRIPREVKVPLQWARDGKPSLRVKKPLGLLFAPAVAMILLFAPTTTGVTFNTGSTENALILFCLRALLAAGFGISILAHLRQVLTTLQAEGSLKP